MLFSGVFEMMMYEVGDYSELFIWIIGKKPQT